MSVGMKTMSLIALAFTLTAPLLKGADSQLPAIIDSHIAARAGGPLSARSDDAEFYRRAHLDLAGIIPREASARSFLADPAPQKRLKLIDRLLSGEDFARHWSEPVSYTHLTLPTTPFV